MNRQEIPRRDKYEYLGVTIDPKLSWKDHISRVCGKANRTANSMTPVAQCWATGGPTSFWPVGQRWPNSDMPLLACHCSATGGPTLGNRWLHRWATVGSHRWANVILASGPTLAQQCPTLVVPLACGMPDGPPVGQHQCHRWANE